MTASGWLSKMFIYLTNLNTTTLPWAVCDHPSQGTHRAPAGARGSVPR